MKTIRIYQIELTRDCEYSFMGYEWAEGKLDMKDYKMVANYIVEENMIGTDDDILNLIWEMGNDGRLQEMYRMRSISVSDIIEINGTKYYVDSFGFKEV